MATTRTELGTDVTETSDALPAGTVLGDYTILRVLGQGGFGVTYLAHDAGLDQDVVLKENMPAQFAGRGGDSLTVSSRGGKEGADSFAWATQRFLDEARLLAKLNHPNIVRVLRAFSALGTAYYVMPWVGGKDLKQFAAARGGVDEAFLRGVLSKLLPALSYLHGHNLLHRDIKPANILCTDNGTPILIDFGTARALVSERSQTMVESAGYTPMEQIQSHGNTGPWTDLYALGATMYRLITGEAPPRSTDRMGKTDCYVPLAGRAELKDGYGAAFLETIDKALAFWPEDRWQNANDWEQALPRIVEHAVAEKNDSSKMPGGNNVSLSGRETPSDGKQVQAPTGRKASGKGRVLAHAVAYLVLISCAVYGWFYYDANWSPHALYANGLKHESGAGVPKSQTKAVEYYRMAAERGHALAQDVLGSCYEKGTGLSVDCAEALKWYLKAAEQGNEHAQAALGRLYAEGDGVPCDMKEAAKWSRMAADQGNVEAQCRLGMCYAEGRGVEKDSAAAAQCFRRAADQGCASAQAKLGDCFALGAGVARDTQEAVRLYRMAVDQGDDAAQVKLGDCYSQGEGVTGDKREAMWLYRRAAERGYAPAQVKLGDCYGRGEGTQRDTQEAVIWYRKADAQGNAQAQYNLGICYANGDGVPRKLEISASFFRKAAEQGHADAQYRLGICYEEGKGVARDLEAAVQWYHKAAGQGNADAQKALKRLGR